MKLKLRFFEKTMRQKFASNQTSYSFTESKNRKGKDN